MLHVTHDNPGNTRETPLLIGENVTIGHSCCLHACTIGNQVLVGMGSIILDNAIVEDQVMLGAGSLVPPGKTLQSGYLYFGNPVKQIRPLTAAEIAHLNYSAKHYIQLAKQHASAYSLSLNPVLCQTS